MVINGRDRRVAIFLVARYATVIADRAIIVRFLGIIYLVQFIEGADLIGHLEEHIVMLIQVLHLFLYFILSLAELLGIIN